MSLRQNLEIALNQHLASGNQLPGMLQVQDSLGQLSLEIDHERIESLGCLILELRFKCLTSKNSFGELQTWSRELCAQITYLLESLGVLEFDPQAGRANIRSSKPLVSQHVTAYYEIMLELTQFGYLTLRRYEFDKQQQQRTIVPLCLTREVLLRLADDLAQTAPSP